MARSATPSSPFGSGRTLAIIRGLYFPNPYSFDAVPLELLGSTYEGFLGKRLRVVGNDIADDFKPEYQRTKCAVYTPTWIVRRVVERTLEPLTRAAEPEAILRLRILDPACGSGAFLLRTDASAHADADAGTEAPDDDEE